MNLTWKTSYNGGYHMDWKGYALCMKRVKVFGDNLQDVPKPCKKCFNKYQSMKDFMEIMERTEREWNEK